MLEDRFEFVGQVKGKLLDDYLAIGWYRTACVVFTTHFLKPYNDERRYRVYWLRYRVEDVNLCKKNQDILKCNEGFSVTYRPFELTWELDELHKRYASGLKFKANNDLEALLTDVTNDIFDSYLIEVRDNGKLIYAGVLDKGEHTIEGIINIYDPGYKKCSPGKFLMLMKYRFCQQLGITYYYPGYYMPEHPLFDYKLFIDKEATEVYVPETEQWVAYNEFIANSEQ